MHEIDTPRARLRPVTMDDLEALHRLWTDPDVRRYLWDGESIPRQLTESLIERSAAQFAARGHGLWLAHDPDSHALIGFCGFWFFREPPQLELLYGVAPAVWSRGLASELATAMLRHGFEVLGFEHITGSTDFANRASARVMEKLGMRRERRATIDGKDTLFFSISRPL
jgi:ribosomal-protein-alanine N-acetyltransferase